MRSADFPFAPSRWPFFYGWIVVVVSTIGTILSIPGQTMGVSAFTDSLIRDLDISRDSLSSAYMGGTIASACLLPFAGVLFDRLGARVMIVISSLALGATLLYFSASERVIEVLSRQAPTVLTKSSATFAALLVGFFSLRFWGQGVLTMVSRAMLGKWFDRRRGFASAFSGIFVSGAFAGAPVALLWRIEASGWRGTFVELSAICLAWAFFGWLLYRDNPEECGLQMDGGPVPLEKEFRTPTPIVHDLTLSEALKTYSFWIASLSLALFGLMTTGLTFHITSIGETSGLDGDEAIAVFVPMAIVAIVSNFTSGWLSDRVRIRNLFCALHLGMALGSASLLAFGTDWGRMTAALGFGIGGGLFSLLTTVIWPRFYGRKRLGAISAASMALTVSGSALGPKIFALAEARDGRYDSSFVFGIASAFVLLIASIWVVNPQNAYTNGAKAR